MSINVFRNILRAQYEHVLRARTCLSGTDMFARREHTHMFVAAMCGRAAERRTSSHVLQSQQHVRVRKDVGARKPYSYLADVLCVRDLHV